MPCKNINNQSNLDVEQYKSYFDNFFPYTQKVLEYDKPFSLNLVSDQDNASKTLGKTAHYDPNSYEVTIYTDGRHIKDILRSISHELVHHTQNCRGEFDREFDTGEGYAQKDGHLRSMEREAYEKGNMLFRDWEDGYKRVYGENVMKKSIKLLKEQGFSPLDPKKQAFSPRYMDPETVAAEKEEAELAAEKEEAAKKLVAISKAAGDPVTLDQTRKMQMSDIQALYQHYVKKTKAGPTGSKKRRRRKPNPVGVALQKQLVNFFKATGDVFLNEVEEFGSLRDIIGSRTFDGKIGKTTLASLQKIGALKGLVNTKRDARKNARAIIARLRDCKGQEEQCKAQPVKASDELPDPEGPKGSKAAQKTRTYDGREFTDSTSVHLYERKKCFRRLALGQEPGLQAAGIDRDEGESEEDFEKRLAQHINYLSGQAGAKRRCDRHGQKAVKKWEKSADPITSLEESKYKTRYVNPIKDRMAMLHEHLKRNMK